MILNVLNNNIFVLLFWMSLATIYLCYYFEYPWQQFICVIILNLPSNNLFVLLFWMSLVKN